jgi:hypothetical protein
MKHLVSLSLAGLATLAIAGCAAPSPMRSDLVKASEGAKCMRLAQPGDQKIQIYCSGKDGDFVLPLAKAFPAGQLRAASASEQKAGDTSCRLLGSRRKVCGTAEEWDQFDTRAVARGVTCRVARGSVGFPAEELCLSTVQWESINRRSRRTAAAGDPVFGWPVGAVNPTPSGNQAYATSYGYFPQGTAIGATTAAPPR